MRRDPSSDPALYAPLNKHGMWKCDRCDHWTDECEDACSWCDKPMNEEDEPEPPEPGALINEALTICERILETCEKLQADFDKMKGQS